MKNRIEEALEIIQNQQEKCKKPVREGDFSFVDAFNVIFKSDSKVAEFTKKIEHERFHKLLLSSCVAHKSKAKNIYQGSLKTLYTEDWLVSKGKDFRDARKREIGILEEVIIGLMIYMLGGFTFPEDSLRKEPLKHMEVDVEEINGEPKKSFILLNISPRYMLFYLMWKIDCITHSLGREYKSMRHKDEAETIRAYLNKRVRINNDNKSS